MATDGLRVHTLQFTLPPPLDQPEEVLFWQNKFAEIQAFIDTTDRLEGRRKE